jgi:hypothetical protein
MPFLWHTPYTYRILFFGPPVQHNYPWHGNDSRLGVPLIRAILFVGVRTCTV